MFINNFQPLILGHRFYFRYLPSPISLCPFTLARQLLIYDRQIYSNRSHSGRSHMSINHLIRALAVSSDLMSHIAHKMQLNWNGLFLGQHRSHLPAIRFHIDASTSFAYLFFHWCAFLIENEISNTHIDNKMSVFFSLLLQPAVCYIRLARLAISNGLKTINHILWQTILYFISRTEIKSTVCLANMHKLKQP